MIIYSKVSKSLSRVPVGLAGRAFIIALRLVVVLFLSFIGFITLQPFAGRWMVHRIAENQFCSDPETLRLLREHAYPESFIIYKAEVENVVNREDLEKWIIGYDFRIEHIDGNITRIDYSYNWLRLNVSRFTVVYDERNRYKRLIFQ